MRIEGRKHGFLIGSGRTIKHCARVGKVDINSLPNQHGLDNLMQEALTEVFVSQNPDTFKLKNGKAVPLVSEEESRDIENQFREFEKNERKMSRKRQVQAKREQAAKLEENIEQIIEKEVDYSNRSTIDQIIAKADKNLENKLRRKVVVA